MSRMQTIKAFCRRRDVLLVVTGLFLVLMTYQFFFGLNYLGPVKLEFVGLARRGTNQVDGTVVAFRLINKSGGDISYWGTGESYPGCEVLPMVKDQYRVDGWPILHPTKQVGHRYYVLPSEQVLENGKERIIFAVVEKAEQSWLLGVPYVEGRRKQPPSWLPASVREWILSGNRVRSRKVVRSEPVHWVIPAYVAQSEWRYQMTEVKTNANGRVTAKMEAVVK